MSLRPVLAAPSAAVNVPSRAVSLAVAGLKAVPSSLPSRGAQLDSRALLKGDREVLIRHGGEVYRLRHTRNDKLILTK